MKENAQLAVVLDIRTINFSVMKRYKLLMAGLSLTLTAILYTGCQKEEFVTNDNAPLISETSTPYTGEDLEGNNLSFPVIWADGYELELREPPAFYPLLDGEWWYVWGEDPENPSGHINSCKPSVKDPQYCSDGKLPGDGEFRTAYRAYLQQDEFNIWQAYNIEADEPMFIDLLDWGDNLEAKDWNLSSHVRTELSLYENLQTPVLQYMMRHVQGWGNNEMHGLQTYLDERPVLGPGNIATIYSHNSRLTIQKLNIDRDSIMAGDLTWIPNAGWTETDPNGENLINEPIFNHAVYEIASSHEDYAAEVNIKGKIIYGYTWNVPNLNEGAGYYRLTFSFDENGGVVPLNTFIDNDTEIIISEEGGHNPSSNGGGSGVLDISNNLTYMDIRILQSGGN